MEREQDPPISVILLLEPKSSAVLLAHSLFSLSLVEWPRLEILILNGTSECAAKAEKLIENQPFRKQPERKSIPSACRRLPDLMRYVSCKYVAFLKADEALYHTGYRNLSDALKRTGAPLAIGSYRTASVQIQPGEQTPFICSKESKPHPDIELNGENHLEVPLAAFLYESGCVAQLETFDLELGDRLTQELVTATLSYPQPAYDMSGIPVCEKRIPARS
ncbi:MAG: hypothetical protein K2W95_22805 [Candidatus Obscuribacterales bacterium]|nr:hypothetical protein [Candidatus Obscuribacterales bacterium]